MGLGGPDQEAGRHGKLYYETSLQARTTVPPGRQGRFDMVRSTCRRNLAGREFEMLAYNRENKGRL